MKVSDATERKTQLIALHLVLSLLVTPTECYHSYVEKYFEWEPTPKTGCGRFCSYGLGQCGDFTKRVNKDGIILFVLVGFTVPLYNVTLKDGFNECVLFRWSYARRSPSNDPPNAISNRRPWSPGVLRLLVVGRRDDDDELVVLHQTNDFRDAQTAHTVIL